MEREWNAFPDGGIVYPNPSPYGGSWAVVYVDARTGQTCECSGHLTPREVGLTHVENNLLETVAILQALNLVPDGVRLLKVFSDNLNAIRRATAPRTAKMGGVPARIVGELVKARERWPAVEFVLIGGHPTKADLARGCREPDANHPHGLPVSRHNVRADELCQMEAKRLADVLMLRPVGG